VRVVAAGPRPRRHARLHQRRRILGVLIGAAVRSVRGERGAERTAQPLGCVARGQRCARTRLLQDSDVNIIDS